MTPCIPVSWGELLDKITILEIKGGRLTSEKARINVRSEMNALRRSVDQGLLYRNFIRVGGQIAALREVNGRLWNFENIVRSNEAQQQFGDAFIQTARAIYRNNDERARLKREINTILQSAIVEEKEHAA